MLKTTQKLLDPETKNFSSIWTEHKTQQIENKGPRAAFSFSFLQKKKELIGAKYSRAKSSEALTVTFL